MVPTATRRDSKLDRLRRQPVLAGCSGPDLIRVARVFDEIDVAAGGIVLETGPLARWFVLIEEGQADVVTAGGDRAVVGPGDTCGGESLFLRSHQGSTVIARSDLRAFIASGRDLLGVVPDVPALARGPLGALVAAIPAPALPARRPSAAPPYVRPIRFRAELRTHAVPNSAQKARRPWRAIVIAAGVAVGFLVAAANYHPPVVMLSPGKAIDISNDVTITGVPVYPLHGRYLLTPVRLTRPSLLKLGAAKLSGGTEVLALQSGADHTALHRAGREVFDNSRTAAAAAAARSAGLQGVPFDVSFRGRDIVGPSAGLAYALLIDDLLGPADVADGRAVAATGTIDATGRVGAVGSIAEKLVGARRARASLMVLPIDQLGQASDARIAAMGVTSLDDALAALAR